jgi:hypothetical protein
MQTYDCEYLLATRTVNMYIQDVSHMWHSRVAAVYSLSNKRCSVSDLQCFLLTMSISIHTNRIPKLLTAVYQYTASTLDAFVLTKLSLKQS